MTSASAGDVTQLLNQMNQGDEAAADSLIRVVYEELKSVATAQMRGGTGRAHLATDRPRQ